MCSHRSIGLIFLSLVPALVLGCAQHATFVQHRPARVTVPIRRLAMLELEAPRSEGQNATAALWQHLEQSGRFELVSTNELQLAAPSPLVDPDGAANRQVAVEAGRRLQVDALLIAGVRFLETDGTIYGSKSLRIGDPEVVAALQYELVDVRSGQTLDRDTVKSETYQGELERRTEESRILSRLARSSGGLAARVLVPFEEEVDVSLAHAAFGPGATDVRKGMELAKDGKWVEARQTWSRVVQSHPDNAAAAYNLAIAHEALGEFTLARQALGQALDKDDKQLYREAFARVVRADAERRSAFEQAAQVGPQLAQLPTHPGSPGLLPAALQPSPSVGSQALLPDPERSSIQPSYPARQPLSQPGLVYPGLAQPGLQPLDPPAPRGPIAAAGPYPPYAPAATIQR